jgi:hypothetical protein
MPSLELDINLRPGVLHLVAQPHQSVVGKDEEDAEDYYDSGYDIDCYHETPPEQV